MNVSQSEYNAILAGLRLLQKAIENGEISADDQDIGAIWSNSQQDHPLDSEEIEELIARGPSVR